MNTHISLRPLKLHSSGIFNNDNRVAEGKTSRGPDQRTASSTLGQSAGVGASMEG